MRKLEKEKFALQQNTKNIFYKGDQRVQYHDNVQIQKNF